jgi:hypothetical protein
MMCCCWGEEPGDNPAMPIGTWVYHVPCTQAGRHLQRSFLSSLSPIALIHSPTHPLTHSPTPLTQHAPVGTRRLPLAHAAPHGAAGYFPSYVQVLSSALPRPMATRLSPHRAATPCPSPTRCSQCLFSARVVCHHPSPGIAAAQFPSALSQHPRPAPPSFPPSQLPCSAPPLRCSGPRVWHAHM